MGQIRNKTGIDFEKSLPSHFLRKATSPKVVWIGEGRNNLKKIVDFNYDEKKMILDFYKSNFDKYDCIDKNTGDRYEVKKYSKKELHKWTLYSEPYFKMSSKENLKIIGPEKYNDFVDRFFEYNTKTGLFENVIKKLTSQTSGIYLEDGLVNMDQFEFKTVVIRNQWAGYSRITIMFKLK